jgi:predicted RNA-binding Zn ribbon-like protein
VLGISANAGTSRSEFIFLGGHAAIDFANTFVAPPGLGIEFLRIWSDVTDWLAEANISRDLPLYLPATSREEALKSVLELRQAWKQVLASLVAGGKVSDDFVARLNGHLGADSFHQVLNRAGKRGFQLARSTSELEGDKLALSILARQIALFLAEANLGYLRRCANTDSCTLYFYDATKNHRRQWCSKATCGNRHRVAEFRRRQSEAKQFVSGDPQANAA